MPIDIDTAEVKRLCDELELITRNIMETQKLLEELKDNQKLLNQKIKALTGRSRKTKEK